MLDCNPLSFSLHALLQPFLCIGCGTFQYRPLCAFCKSQWVPLLKPFEGILDSAPVYSCWFGNTITYRAFRQWKLTGSPRLSEQLFKIHPELLVLLKSQNFECVVPIPQDSGRSWKRGFESAVAAAQVFADALQIPIHFGLELKKTDRSTHQAMKDRLDRTLSANPFVVPKNWAPRTRMLLVDDVVTTGATLQHAIATLKELNPSRSLEISAGALVYKPAGRQNGRKTYKSFVGADASSADCK